MLTKISKTQGMKINYNEKDHSVEIKDTYKTQYWISNVSLIFAIINCVLFPVYILEKKQMAWFGFFWIIIGIAALIGLIYQIMKKSASEKLYLSEINALAETQFFGRKRISLKLKNGKLRDLTDVKNESDIRDMKKFFTNIGIETIRS